MPKLKNKKSSKLKKYFFIAILSVFTLILFSVFSFTLYVKNQEKVARVYEFEPEVAGVTTTSNRIAGPISRKVMVLEFNPIIEQRNNQRLNRVLGWSDPKDLESQFIKNMANLTKGVVDYKIVDRQIVDAIPAKQAAATYTDQTYLNCVENSMSCIANDLVNYRKILTDYKVCEKLNAGLIDELWLWGGPYFGYYEAVMAGPNAFWTNEMPITGTSCQRHLHIMGFNYQRTLAEMLEDVGHRVEGTMSQAINGSFDNWKFKYSAPAQSAPANLTVWDKFTARGFDPYVAGCGNIHGSLNTPVYDPSNPTGYDWSNANIEPSTCENFLNYPNLTGQTSNISCTTWGGCSANGYLKGRMYWISRIPKYVGNAFGGIWNNWWRYILDYENKNLPEKLLTCNSYCLDDLQCKTVNTGYKCVRAIDNGLNWDIASAWSPAILPSVFPGSGLIQSISVDVNKNSIIQSYWRNNQGYFRTVPIVNNNIVWNQASSWNGPFGLDSLPGTGDIQDQAGFVIRDTYHQTFFRGNVEWYRSAPVTNNGSIQWDQASNWQQNVSISNLPGTGDIQGYNTYILESRLFQSVWRNNTEYTRVVFINGDKPDWNDASPWVAHNRTWPGSGSFHAHAGYIVGDTYYASVWRNNLGYSQTIPVGGRCRKATNISNLSCQ